MARRSPTAQERILYPLKSPNGLPWLVFPVGFVVLTGISWAAVRVRRPVAAPPGFVISQRSR